VVIVEMLHTEGCPNAVEYLPRLRTLVADTGVSEPVRVRRIDDPEQAQRERFLGRWCRITARTCTGGGRRGKTPAEPARAGEVHGPPATDAR
jgi:hypothetical protein